VNLFKQLLLIRAQYRDFEAELARFRGMSDDDLARLGLVRGDVVRKAFANSERHPETSIRGRLSMLVS
jgi:hypothetical protein